MCRLVRTWMKSTRKGTRAVKQKTDCVIFDSLTYGVIRHQFFKRFGLLYLEIQETDVLVLDFEMDNGC